MKTINYYPSDTTIGSFLFNNYIYEEIRCLSVKELTSSQAIDRLGASIHFYEQINEYMKLNPPSSTKIEVTTKNLLTIRQQLIKDFETRAFKTKKKFCPNCNIPVRALRADSHSKRFYSQGLSNKQIKAYQERMSNVRQSKKLNDNDESIDNDEEEMLTKMMFSQMYLTPLDVLKHLEKIWTNEKEVLAIYLATLRSSHHSITHVHNNPMSLFFFEVLHVFYLQNFVLYVLSFNDQKFENPKTVRYSTIIQNNQYMKELLLLKDKQTTDISTSTTNRSSLTNTLHGVTNEEKLNNLWLKMQITVNSIFDSSLDNQSGARVAKGIRQVIEKQEGLFRMHMMDKRVNYAGRSVISPDPFIAIYEVGIPEIFTKKLTYPELFTPHNVHKLHYFRANFVELEDGTIRRLLPNNLSQRTAVAKLLLTREKQHSNTSLISTKKVYRHLRTGDYVLVNRQPTLHRPSSSITW
ncbi:unnamed protein product [Rotaria sp. Silwood1]|nr:unnamed protein product [Rotaria sp. Silwood1]CAF1599027.1 unnamed protein product [Rotaria sp. Silwood1]CAF3718716.1 unnamed protein product [Rotaria sp. Silwood1]CAF4583607.1 unnamed protein product [Rotaria sp. Silwood1]CAF4592707.1 unnamed protein product [Rotaria sp. Silwood1]